MITIFLKLLMLPFYLFWLASHSAEKSLDNTLGRKHSNYCQHCWDRERYKDFIDL